MLHRQRLKEENLGHGYGTILRYEAELLGRGSEALDQGHRVGLGVLVSNKMVKCRDCCS
jgi:hypothetical protein